MSLPPIPITIITGFLGSGKTTLILNLLPQLPPDYKLALLKNEFGDVAIDSKLASQSSISGVQELLGGCICCNLVGSLGDALATLRADYDPDRIVIETSGSAFPATLAMEVNRLAGDGSGEQQQQQQAEEEQQHQRRRYVLDGVVSVVDVENWKGYEDTSVTARLQAQYTDLIVLNKWEGVGERRLDEVVDRILDLDLDVPTPTVKSHKGSVDKDILLGLDSKLAKLGLKDLDKESIEHSDGHDHAHDKADQSDHDHQSEVEVLSVTLSSKVDDNGVDLEKLYSLLKNASKDEVYRIKAILYAVDSPVSSNGEKITNQSQNTETQRYILNWAFGRWSFTLIQNEKDKSADQEILNMTIVTAKYEAIKWKKNIESGGQISPIKSIQETHLSVTKIL